MGLPVSRAVSCEAPELYTREEGIHMDSKLRAKVLTMAAATLGLSLAASGCGKKEAAEPEAGEAASGSESSCGAGSCGAAAEGESKEAPAEGAAEGEGGGESSCGGGSCGGEKQ